MNRIWNFITSLRLTVTLLSLAIVLVFLGTFAQVQEGLWMALDRWFRSPLVIRNGADPWWVPPIFPGGYAIGIALLVNLLAAHVKRFTMSAKKLGIHMTHFGVVVLLIGEFLTGVLSQESHMSFREGETRQYSEDHRDSEVVFATDAGVSGQEEVVSFAEQLVAQKSVLSQPKLPFTARVTDYGVNCEIRQRAPMVDTAPPPATKGMGANVTVVPAPETRASDRRNLPYTVLDIQKDGQSLGTWLLSPWLDGEEIQVDGRTYRMAFRPVRYYHPFSVSLLKVTHEKYPGTEIPKNYQSRVRVSNPQQGEDRSVDIYMNNPLRYAGFTFFQYQMGRDERRSLGTSTLQVVKNPGWIAPYLGCILVGLGMTYQFMYHLVAFVKKRRTPAPVAVHSGPRKRSRREVPVPSR